MAKEKILLSLGILLIIAIIVPQIALAAWWNPFSWQIWGMWGRIFNKSEVVFSNNCNALTAQINDLVKKSNYCQKDSDCLVSTEATQTCQCFGLINKNVDLVKIKEGEKKYTTLKCPALQCKPCLPAPSQQDVKCQNKKCVSGPEPTIIGGDKDSHGCIGSAGYTWCQAKQKCLRSWEEPCNITVKEIKVAAPIRPISNIDFEAGYIDAKITPGNKTIKIIINQNTTFHSTCFVAGDGRDNFYNLNKNWVGPTWWYNVTGPESDNGSIIFANTISCIAQL